MVVDEAEGGGEAGKRETGGSGSTRVCVSRADGTIAESLRELGPAQLAAHAWARPPSKALRARPSAHAPHRPTRRPIPVSRFPFPLPLLPGLNASIRNTRHLESGARARRERQVAAAVQRHLVPELHEFGPQFRGERIDRHAVFVDVRTGHELAHLHAMQRIGECIEHAIPIGRELGERADDLEHARAVALGECVEQAADLRAIDRAEHRGDRRVVELAAGVGDGLVEQRQAVAQAAVGGARELADRAGLRGNAFGFQDPGDLAADLRLVQPLEVELQAAREDGDRQLLRVGGRQQELHVLRRLFQRLEQRVEGRLRQHVHFVDQVDLARGRALGMYCALSISSRTLSTPVLLAASISSRST